MMFRLKSICFCIVLLSLFLIAGCSKGKTVAENNNSGKTTEVVAGNKTDKDKAIAKAQKEVIIVNGKVYKVSDIYNMKDEQIKQFMRDVIDDRLDPNYPAPDYIQYGTSTEAMYETFYTRYPHFAFQQDAALRTEVSFRPQTFVDMIRENKLLRNKATLLEAKKSPKK